MRFCHADPPCTHTQIMMCGNLLSTLPLQVNGICSADVVALRLAPGSPDTNGSSGGGGSSDSTSEWG